MMWQRHVHFPKYLPIRPNEERSENKFEISTLHIRFRYIYYVCIY